MSSIFPLNATRDAEKWYVSHGEKDIRDVNSRMKLLLKQFGKQAADQITPAQVDYWISEQEDWSSATGNRYKATNVPDIQDRPSLWQGRYQPGRGYRASRGKSGVNSLFTG